MSKDVEIKLRADVASAVQGMHKAASEIRGLGGAVTQAAGSLKPFNTAISQLERGIGGLGKAGRGLRNVLGAVGIGLGIKSVIDATVKQEQVMAQIEARIRSTGAAAGWSADELAQLAQELSNVSTFGDEVILGMESVLLTFTRIRGSVFSDATAAILDMSVALNQDLKSAALQVGKALNDPIRGVSALSDAGIQFTDAQRGMIRSLVETGDIVGAQRIILHELQTEFGGAAHAARDTLGGALAGLRNAFGDLFEAKSGISEMRQEIEDLTTVLQDERVVRGVDRLVSAMLRLGGVAAKGITEFTAAASDFGRMAALNFGDLDRITELEAKLERARDMLGASVLTRGKFFSEKGFFHIYSDEEIQGEITKLQAQLDAALGIQDRYRKDAGRVADKIKESQKRHSDDLVRVKEDETRRIKDELRKQIDAYKDANRKLENVLNSRKAMEDKFRKIREQLGQQPGEQGGSFSDIATNFLAPARQALAAGDMEKAIQLAEEGADALAKLREAGKLPGELGKAQAQGLLDMLHSVAQEASAAQEAAAKLDLSAAKKKIDDFINGNEALKQLKIGFDTESATQNADALRQALQEYFNSNPVTVPVDVQKPSDSGDNPPGDLPTKAGGGLILGPGTETSDSVLARLSRGEYVVRAAAVRRYGVGLLHDINRLSLPRFARGGLISQIAMPTVAPPPSSQGQNGVPIHLHLDRQTYSATASGDVASGLALAIGREARKRGRRFSS